MRGRACPNRSPGFTLVEMIVVIAIILLLLAIMIPIATRLQAGQRLQSCQMNLNRIGQAIRMYRLDEGGFPPYEFVAGPPAQIRGRGLFALVDTNYIRSRNTLRCPADDRDYATGGGPDDPGYNALAFGYGARDPISYMWIDPQAAAGPVGPPPFKYLTGRGPGTHSDYSTRIPRLRQGSGWQPDDTTVLTWCDFHQRVITEAGNGQYLVLFYDGHAERIDAALFRTGNAGADPPEEGWRVRPGQKDWDGAGGPVY